MKSFLAATLPLLRELRDPILREFQRRWPISGPGKAHYFVDLVFVVVMHLDTQQFLEISEPFFNFVSQTGFSANLALADTVLNLFLGPEGTTFVSANSGLIIEKLYQSLIAIARGHLFQEIREKAIKVLAHLKTLNAPECAKQHEKSQERDVSEISCHHNHLSPILNWSAVIMSQEWDNHELKNAKIQEVKRVYEQPSAVLSTHFLPMDSDMITFVTQSTVRKRADTFSAPIMTQARRHSMVLSPTRMRSNVRTLSPKLPVVHPVESQIRSITDRLT
jgi:hypothetical protein